MSKTSGTEVIPAQPIPRSATPPAIATEVAGERTTVATECTSGGLRVQVRGEGGVSTPGSLDAWSRLLPQLELRLFGRSLEHVTAAMKLDARLRRVWERIENEHDCPLPLSTLCDAGAGISSSQLGRLMREITGFTAHQMLKRYRVLKAAELIATTDHSLLRIAIDVGFGDPGGLTRSFKALLGDTPREFRKN